MAHALTLSIYRVTRNFPEDERYGLTSQLRRAAASVPTNIAEGCKRSKWADYARFLNIAEGSASETKYLLSLVRDLEFISSDTAHALLSRAESVSRMLFRLRSAVQLAGKRDEQRRKALKRTLREPVDR